MSEKSLLWTTGATGDGTTEYTQAEVIRWQRQTFINDDDEGVLRNYGGKLITTGTSSPVAVATGAAYVHGFPYWNTASVDVAIPTPSGNTRIDRVVLRANWSAQTVRITRIAGTEGSGTPPALVQTDGTTWDIPLARCSITTGGVITVTVDRIFIHPNIAVNSGMLDADAVTLAKMAANSVDSPQYVDGSIDAGHLAAGAVIAGNIATGGVSATSEIADQIITSEKILNRVALLKKRQGGSATIWSTSGTTDYGPLTVRIIMQAGCVEWTSGIASDMGTTTITFPDAFSYAPLVFPSLWSYVSARDDVVVTFRTPTTTQVTLVWRDTGGGTHTSMLINWLAIGPE